MAEPKPLRADRQGQHRTAFEKNRRIILATQEVCGICGAPVDKTLRYPNPMAPCVDHIIPISRGGHPSDLSNLQLAHWWCNRQKSDKLFRVQAKEQDQETDNDDLPQSMDWATYRAKRD